MVTVCYMFWVSVEMDTISQRMCNWGDNGWMIGTGHKQFFCQGYKHGLENYPRWQIHGGSHFNLGAPCLLEWLSVEMLPIPSQNETEKSSGARTWIPAINRSLFSHRHQSTCCTGRSPMAVCFMWYFEAMIAIKTVAGLWNQKERHTQEWPSSLRSC